MIVIEPSPPPAALGPLNKRELRSFLAEAIRAVPVAGAVTVLLTDDVTIRRLNKRFRHMNKATDVLSFPADPNVPGHGKRSAGDLAISLETAARQAGAFEHSMAVEVKILLVHGLLHLAGLDHEADAGEMARRERELREKFGLPLGLIERTADSANPRFAKNAKDGPPRSVPNLASAKRRGRAL